MTNIFTDPRDGEIYKTVKINDQIWMAENLRYRGPVKKFNNWTIEEKEFYFAPNGDRRNIKNYGCLYSWKNAFKAVPEGWHLPSTEDFINLLRYSGSDKAKRFKALAASDWIGDDTLGFRALPAGTWRSNFGNFAFFWSATKFTMFHSIRADYLILYKSYAGVDDDFTDCAYSVRCIKD